MAITQEVEDFGVRFKPPVRPKKRTGDTSFALDSRIMLLSFLSGPDNIPVIADIYERTLTSPDFMVECITGEEINDPAALDQVKLHVESMDPKLGMCLIIIDGNIEGPLPTLPEKVRPL
jgi:hypothetical protein